MTRLEEVKSNPRSWSQLSEYERCGHAYYLNRVERVWNRPASWLQFGTAVHEACELWERSGRTATRAQAAEWFVSCYVREMAKTLNETPNLTFWESSGPYRGEADAVRRYHVGIEHVNRYIDFYESPKTHDQVIWITPEGEPAIELEFNVPIGNVQVRGKIDAIVDHPKKGLIIRDTKSGSKVRDASQLSVYRSAVEELMGVDVLWGDFLMTNRGTPTRTTDLTLVPGSEIIDRFEAMDQGVKAGVFTPNPGENCARCSVRDSCEFRKDGE